MSILEGILDSPSGDEYRNLTEYCSLLWKLTALWVIRCVFILPQRRPLSVVGPIGDKLGRDSFVRFVPCVDGSELARTFFTFAALVGAAMCSAFKVRHTGPLAIMPSADQVPVNRTHSTMRWHKWVV